MNKKMDQNNTSKHSVYQNNTENISKSTSMNLFTPEECKKIPNSILSSHTEEQNHDNTFHGNQILIKKDMI